MIRLSTEKPLAPGDTFAFQCLACGKCCTHIHGVPLGGYDLYKIARRFGLAPKQALDRFFHPVAAGFMARPVLKVDRRGFCVLLREGLCAIHEDKPFVCKLYPIQPAGKQGRGRFSFTPDCYEPCGIGEQHTLAQWLRGIGEQELRNSQAFDEIGGKPCCRPGATAACRSCSPPGKAISS